MCGSTAIFIDPQHIEVKVRIIYGVTQSGEVTGEGPIWAVATRLQEMDVYVLESLSKRTFDLCTSNINKVYLSRYNSAIYLVHSRHIAHTYSGTVVH